MTPRRSTRSSGPRTLDALAADRRRGAAEIAAGLLEWAKAWGEGEADGDPVATVEALTRLARAQATLAPVLRIANDLLVEIERREGGEEAGIRSGALAVADRWQTRLAAAVEALTLHLRRAFEGLARIYTYSASSTVARAIEAHCAAGHWFEVVLSESRPGNEGARLAAALAERGVRVRLGTDAWLWSALDEPGALVVGADALLPTGWVNKLGTAALAERSRAAGIAVVVAADTSKWLPATLAALPRVYDRDPSEIVFEPPPALEALNPYFEELPYAALDQLVTERGITRPQDLRAGEVTVAQALR